MKLGLPPSAPTCSRRTTTVLQRELELTALAIAAAHARTQHVEIDRAALDLFASNTERYSAADLAAITPEKARQLVVLLSHPEIRVTPLPAATAIEECRRLETEDPSFETLRRGEPRSYEPPKRC